MKVLAVIPEFQCFLLEYLQHCTLVAIKPHISYTNSPWLAIGPCQQGVVKTDLEPVSGRSMYTYLNLPDSHQQATKRSPRHPQEMKSSQNSKTKVSKENGEVHSGDGSE